MLRAIVLSFGIVYAVIRSFDGVDSPSQFEQMVSARHAEIEAVAR